MCDRLGSWLLINQLGYYLVPFPRVTEILNAYTNFSNVPSQVLSRAAARGTTVHAICAGIAKGSWVPDSMIDPEHLGYVTSFRKWMGLAALIFEIVEVRYRHETLKFTGQIDFVVQTGDGKKILVDIKTSAKHQKTYPLQIGAYRILLQNSGITIDSAAIVYLNKDGEFPKVHVIEDFTEHEHIFKSALDCWHYFNKGKVDD